MDLVLIKVAACPKCMASISSEHQSSRGEKRSFACGYVLQVTRPSIVVTTTSPCRHQPAVAPSRALGPDLIDQRIAAVNEVLQYVALMKCDDALRNYLKGDLLKALKLVGGL